MQHYTLSARQQYNGNFTDLWILGTKRVRASTSPYGVTSDFTAAATTQTFTLYTFVLGDVVIMPAAQMWVKQKFTDHATEDTAAATLANLKMDLGYSGATTAFIAGTNADLQQAKGAPTTGQAAAWLGYPYKTGSIDLVATATSTAGNMSTITYGDLFIYIAIARVGDHVTNINA